MLSVVIAAYNSAPWLPSTLDSVRVALEQTSWSAEIVIVNDGSTDGSQALLANLAQSYPYEIRVINQENQGIFFATWNGLTAARSRRVLLVNSRLLLHEDCLAYLERQDALESDTTWNGHVITDPSAPLVGQFWDVPLRVFWGQYLRNPKPTIITAENFDRLPTGTTYLLVSRDTMLEASRVGWPTANSRFTSDDTRVLRHIVAQEAMVLDPGFSATYRPRVTFGKFISHANERGTKFVDSYAGTSPARSLTLVALALAPVVIVLTVTRAVTTGNWRLAAGVGGVAAMVVSTPAVIAAAYGARPRAMAAYFKYIVPFGVAFWPGLVRGIVMHRGAFKDRGRRSAAGNAGTGRP